MTRTNHPMRLVLFTAISLAAGAAQAQINSYGFIGQVTDSFFPLSAYVEAGAQASGSFAFDSLAQQATGSDATTGIYTGTSTSGFFANVSLPLGSANSYIGDPTTVTVENNPSGLPFDAITFSAVTSTHFGLSTDLTPGAQWEPLGFEVRLTDATGTALASTSLPGILDLGMFDTATFSIRFADTNNLAGGFYYISGTLSTFEGGPPSPLIPEPSTYALILAGLGVVVCASRRREKSRRSVIEQVAPRERRMAHVLLHVPQGNGPGRNEERWR